MRKFSIRLLLPLILSEAFWIASYVLYRYGAVKYPFADDNILLVFLALCDLMYCIGYLLVLKFAPLSSAINTKNALDNSKNIEKLLFLCIVISIAVAVPNSIRNTGNWYPPIITNLMNPGDTYHKVTAGVLENSILRIFGFFDIFPFMIFPLIFSAWDKIGKKIKIAGCVVTFYYLLIYCAGGRNMPCFLFGFSAIVTYFAKMCFHSKKTKVTIIRDFCICLFAIALIVIMFTVNLKSRNLYTDNVEDKMAAVVDVPVEETKAPQEDIVFISPNPAGELMTPNDNDEKVNPVSGDTHDEADKESEVYLQYKDLVITNEQKEKCEVIGNIFPMYTNPYTKEYVDPDNFLYKLIPNRLKFTCVTASSYISGSYHVLSVALRMEHKWTYGMGFSEFLQSYVKALTGIDIKALSYGNRAVALTDPPIISTYGWGTAYMQLADDLTFPGVIIFLGCMGAMVAYLWKDITEKANIFAIPFCIQMALMIVFMSANCITFNSGGYFVTFWGTALIWGISLFKSKRRKANV